MATKQAFNAKRTTSFVFDPNELVIIGIDTDDVDHPLLDTHSNALSVDEGLVRSLIEMDGNIQDITIYKDEEKRPVVVAGRSRVRAARVANRRLAEKGKEPIGLRASVVRGSKTRLELVSLRITENELRRTTTPMEKARLLQDMITEGASDVDAATTFGVTTTAIRQWKKLLNLAPEVAEAVDSKEISSSAAMNLAAFDSEEQVTELEKIREQKGKVTTAATKRSRQNATGPKRHKTPYEPPKKKKLKKLVQLEDLAVPDHVAIAIKWVLGQADVDEVPGLKESLEALERQEALKLSASQHKVVALISEKGPQLASQIGKRTLSALVDKEVVEMSEADDGLEYASLTEVGKKIAG